MVQLAHAGPAPHRRPHPDDLRDQLEEEREDDRDYFIDGATIDMLADKGASTRLIDLLRNALGTDEPDRSEGPFR